VLFLIITSVPLLDHFMGYCAIKWRHDYPPFPRIVILLTILLKPLQTLRPTHPPINRLVLRVRSTAPRLPQLQVISVLQVERICDGDDGVLGTGEDLIC